MMNLILALVTLTSVGLAHAQQGEKGNSIIPFPRVGRSGTDRFFMSDKRSGNSPGLIPFPRIGRDGPHEIKRQLIPFPRVGKRPFWPMAMEPSYFAEYEDYSPMMDQSNHYIVPSGGFPMEASLQDSESDIEKRNGNPNASGGMWFGPRLGRRRKRSISDSSSASESSADTLDMKPLLKMLHNSNWAIIVPVKELRYVLLTERRNFTPRLGRSSHEAVVVHQRAQPFSPRLGRSGEVASHEFDTDDEVQTRTHYQRRNQEHGQPGTDIPIDITGPPFSPRLGRSDPFSPRLGRSGDDRE